jgi:hypothetical protein
MLDKRHGKVWTAARRFGLRQGTEKIRAIDDYSEHGQNATVTCDEKVPLSGVDAIVSIMKVMASAVRDDRSVNILGLKGVLRESWMVQEASTILGRCVDLKSAYRQLVRRRADAHICIIAVWNPREKKVEFFEQIALPFGATAAVHSFNRPAVCLRTLFIRLFRMCLGSFFDDFPVLEYGPIAEETGDIMLEALKLFGWEVSEDKLKPFAAEFEALGVKFDSTALNRKPEDACIVIQNTDKRKQAIEADIAEVLKTNAISPSRAANLRGRLAYMEAQNWSRIGSLVLADLTSEAALAGSGWAVRRTTNAGEVGLRHSLSVALWLVKFAPPRKLFPWADTKCNVTFVDGAAEGEGHQNASVGAVLFAKALTKPLFFGLKVPRDIVEHWASKGSKQIITQAEIAPVLIAKRLWSNLYAQSRNLWFIDNEGARESLIGSTSTSWAARELVFHIKLEDTTISPFDWFARVPTQANIADCASRLEFEPLLQLEAEQKHPEFFTVKELKSKAGDILSLFVPPSTSEEVG